MREVKLANGIDESASVVVDHGMVSLVVEQTAPRRALRESEARDWD